MVEYQRLILPNGLRVLLHENKHTPLVAVNLLVNAGSKFDPHQKSGLAHLFEHLMFSGTPEVPDFDEPIQMAGAENNAFTNSDYANYYSYGPQQNLETLLWLEADRISNLNISKQSFDTQQKVVIEELHESCLNVPYGDVWHHLLPLIYKDQDHPYRWPTIGLTAQEIGSIAHDDAFSFYKSHYHIGNSILSVAGNFDSEHVTDLISEYFSWNGEYQNGQRHFPFDIQSHHARDLVVAGDVPLEALFMAFPMPGRIDQDYYVLDLLSDLLSVGKSSLIYKHLIKESEVLSTGDAFITGTHDSGLFVIEGKLAEGVDMEEARKRIWEVVQKLYTELLDDRIIQKLKNNLEASVVYSEISTLSKAMNLSYFELIGDASLINKEAEKYQHINAEDLLDVAKKYLQPSHCSTILYKPAKS